jgi:NitT/TauT family transport system permease protein
MLDGSGTPAGHNGSTLIRRSSTRPRRRRKLKGSERLLGVFSIVAGLAIWQLISGVFVRNELILPTPIEAGNVLWHQLGTQTLWSNIGYSLTEVGIGFAITAVIGLLIGGAMAVSPTVHNLVQPWVELFYVVPVIALAPLFVIIFGLGMLSKIAMVIVTSLFVIIINTEAGVRNASPDLVEMARAFGKSRLAIFRGVQFPGSLPVMFAGLRLGVGRAFIAVVVAEMFGATRGLGYAMFSYMENLDTSAMIADIVVLAILGYLSMKLLDLCEYLLSPYRRVDRGAK